MVSILSNIVWGRESKVLSHEGRGEVKGHTHIPLASRTG